MIEGREFHDAPFPNEIWDLVFAHTSGPPGTRTLTLSACTLVSKRWYRLALPHLFEIMYIRGMKSRYGRTHKFFDFLHAHAHICKVIKHLVVWGNWDISLQVLDCSDTLTPLLPKLTALRVLTVKGVALTQPSPLPLPAPLPIRLKRLYVCIPAHPSAPTRLSSLYALLSIVAPSTFDACTVSHHWTSASLSREEVLAFQSTPTPSTGSVEIARLGPGLEGVLDVFTDVLRADTLEVLSISCRNSPACLKALPALVRSSAGARITQLEINLECGTDDEPAWLLALGDTIAACGVLHTLRLILLYLKPAPDECWPPRRPSAPPTPPRPLFARLLARPPRTLRTLVLHLEDVWHGHYDRTIDLRDLACLDDRAGPAVSGLVAFSVRAELAETDAEEIVYTDLEWDVREALPGFDAQGRLSVVRVPPLEHTPSL